MDAADLFINSSPKQDAGPQTHSRRTGPQADFLSRSSDRDSRQLDTSRERRNDFRRALDDAIDDRNDRPHVESREPQRQEPRARATQPSERPVAEKSEPLDKPVSQAAEGVQEHTGKQIDWN